MYLVTIVYSIRFAPFTLARTLPECQLLCAHTLTHTWHTQVCDVPLPWLTLGKPELHYYTMYMAAMVTVVA